jgi:hypothetical protein
MAALWCAMTRCVLFIFLTLVTSCPAIAETIEYEIYELPTTRNGVRKLIGTGTRTYAVSEVQVQPYKRGREKIAEKFIVLEGTYKVGARIFYEKELTGFGLLARHSSNDFSWEWYDKKQENLFEKLQGKSHVVVKTAGLPMHEELIEVNFLADTELRFIAHRKGMKDTHVIVVKSGSVLRFK